MSRRYLLCVPASGFNDTLMEIQRALVYCREYGRSLIINTKNSPLYDDFGNYFTVVDNVVGVTCSVTDELWGRLNEMSVYPNPLHGRVHDCVVSHYEDGKYYTQIDGQKVKLTVRLDRDYEEQCVVLAAGRGGIPSTILPCLRITKMAQQHVFSKLENIPPPYTAIHVRNTDWDTDYKTFFSEVVGKIKHMNLLVCTDDYQCFNDAVGVFGSKHNVFALSVPPDNSETRKARHLNFSVPVLTKNLDMLADLFGMACSDQFLFSLARPSFNPSQLKKSGFSELAETLHNDKPLLDKILGIPYL